MSEISTPAAAAATRLHAIVIRGLALGMRAHRDASRAPAQLLAMLHACLQRILAPANGLVLQRRGWYLVVGGTPFLAPGEDQWNARRLVRSLRRLGIAELRIDPALGVTELAHAVRVLGDCEAAGMRGGEVVRALRRAHVRHLIARPDPSTTGASRLARDAAWIPEQARLLYGRLVQASAAVDPDHLGSREVVAQHRELVQRVVDAFTWAERPLLELTALRSLERDSTHRANVAVITLACARNAGVDRAGMLRLGLAALWHDVGSPCDMNSALHDDDDGATDDVPAAVRGETVARLLAGLPLEDAGPIGRALLERVEPLEAQELPAPRACSQHPTRTLLAARLITRVDRWELQRRAAAEVRSGPPVPWAESHAADDPVDGALERLLGRVLAPVDDPDALRA